MRIFNVVPCVIMRRVNKFVVQVKLSESVVKAYVNNTGKLEDYMVSGRIAYCVKFLNPRKTAYRLIAISDGMYAAIVDTKLQMIAFERSLNRELIPWLKGCRVVKRNPRLYTSVLDYMLKCDSEHVYLEIKSAVLRGKADVAMYPDCISLRGRRHIRDLINVILKGNKSILVFIAAIPHAKAFKLNKVVDEKIYELTREAVKAGVMVKAVGIFFNPYNSTVVLENPDLKVII